MTTKEIAFYYKNLPNGEKGRFTAHISLELGGSPHSWQQKVLKWFNEEKIIPPAIATALSLIIEGGKWK